MRSQDVRGFLVAAALASTPNIAITCMFEFGSKEEPIGLRAYLLPTAIGVIVSLPFSITARWVARRNPNPFYLYASAGIAAGLLLILTFCAGGGAVWSYNLADEWFRSRPGY